MTLEEFISSVMKADAKFRDTRMWVTAPGFESLYVRRSVRIDPDTRDRVVALDIANMTARTPRGGAFTKLLDSLEKEHPELSIYVESVLHPRVGEFLLRRGFKKIPYIHDASPCFLKRGQAIT